MNLKIENLLRTIVSAFSRRTKDPVITFTPPNQYSLQVHADDHGRLVGKNGIVVWALKTLVWYAGVANHGQPCSLELCEPFGQKSSTQIPYKPKTEVDKAKWGGFLDVLISTCTGREKSAWAILEEEGRHIMTIRLDKYLKIPTLTESPIDEAIQTVVHAAGKADGISMDVKVEWTA